MNSFLIITMLSCALSTTFNNTSQKTKCDFSFLKSHNRLCSFCDIIFLHIVLIWLFSLSSLTIYIIDPCLFSFDYNVYYVLYKKVDYK